MIFVGVDPGLSGAIAATTGDAWAKVWDMPTLGWGKTTGKRAVDLNGIVNNLQSLPILDDCAVFIERVNAMPGQGVSSMFSLGMSMYGAAGVFVGMGWPVHFVESRTWKAYWKLPAEKEFARGLAARMFPSLDLSKKKHHGRAEALLIARYAQETFKV